MVDGEAAQGHDSSTIITTTDNLEGYRITNYFAPVVASIVAGTGFVGGFLAGVTNTSGGRSESYQQALSNLYADSTREIEAGSAWCGAIAAVGARFEFSQISGRACRTGSARRIRATYCDQVCASFLVGKANELSMGAIELSAADLPESSHRRLSSPSEWA